MSSKAHRHHSSCTTFYQFYCRRAMIRILLVFTLWIASGSCQQNFTGHKLLAVFASDKEELKVLRALTENPEIDFWTDPVALNEMVDVRVPPEVAEDLEKEFRTNGIDFYFLTENLQEWIDTEREENPPDDEWTGPQKTFPLDVYHTFEAISSYLDSVAAKYPQLASIRTFGTSYEGNPIKTLKIGFGNRNKMAVWIDAGIHAREWVAPAAAIYFINQLVTGYDTDPGIKRLVNRFDWYILPVANPDGYKYTWTTNRMWRKNRSRDSPSSSCWGTDPNRNFDSYFGGEGSSSDPCSQTYHGSSVFSEAESRAIRDGVLGIGNVQAYFSLHAYSQLWMIPYGYTKDDPPHYKDQIRALRAAAAAIKKTNGLWYRYGTVANTIYPASGSSLDWAYDAAKIKYSFAIEMRDTGKQGFLLSNHQIIPNAEENWEGIKNVVKLIYNEQRSRWSDGTL